MPTWPPLTNCAAIQVPMSRSGSLAVSDLIGKLDVLRVECPKCGRACRHDTLPRLGDRYPVELDLPAALPS
jgi:hypothetical protein